MELKILEEELKIISMKKKEALIDIESKTKIGKWRTRIEKET